jgi:hypothetical protein
MEGVLGNTAGCGRVTSVQGRRDRFRCGLSLEQDPLQSREGLLPAVSTQPRASGYGNGNKRGDYYSDDEQAY